MSEPTRLREEAGAFERALLQAASLDREPEDGVARALAALGVTVSATTLAIAPTTPTALPRSGALGAGGLVKASGVALLAAGLVAAALVASPPAAPSGAPSSVVTAPGTATTSSPPSTSAVEELLSVRSVAVTDLPAAATATSNERSRQKAGVELASRRVPVASKATMAEELAFIDRARAALARGDREDAARTLDAYAMRCPNGELALEGELARIELFLQRAEPDRARELCEQFLREHPATPYERRARSLLRRAIAGATISQ